MEKFELYLIVLLGIILIGVVINTIQYYIGEKQKIKNLHRFANAGDVQAQQDLAKRYKEGDMVPQDKRQAAFWSQRASFLQENKAKGALENYLLYKKKKKR